MPPGMKWVQTLHIPGNLETRPPFSYISAIFALGALIVNMIT